MYLRRVLACFIDLLIVYTLSIMISRVDVCNPYYEQYNEYATKYNELVEEKTSDFNNLDVSTLLKDLGFFFLYFVVFQFFTGGQTLGKRLFNLKVVNNSEEEEDVKFNQLLRRSLFIGSGLFRGITVTLIINTIVNLITFKSLDIYYVIFTGIGVIAFIYEIVFIFYYMFNKKHRGINDIIGGTKVIDLRKWFLITFFL